MTVAFMKHESTLEDEHIIVADSLASMAHREENWSGRYTTRSPLQTQRNSKPSSNISLRRIGWDNNLQLENF